MAGPGHLISIHPEELIFQLELKKLRFCDLKVTNNTENCVAFKMKTTSPKKYCVRPNTGVIEPWDSGVIRVTLQAQKEYPPDMQCKDKFLLQSTTVASHADVDDHPQDTFNKDNGKIVEECKPRVIYQSPQPARNSEDEALKSFKQSSCVTAFLDEALKSFKQSSCMTAFIKTRLKAISNAKSVLIKEEEELNELLITYGEDAGTTSEAACEENEDDEMVKMLIQTLADPFALLALCTAGK